MPPTSRALAAAALGAGAGLLLLSGGSSRPGRALQQLVHVATDAEAPGYRPIFMMHGIDDNAKNEWTTTIDWLQELHPGTPTYPIAMFEDMPASWEALPHQIDKIADYIRKVVASDPAQFANGYHLLCHSQGGLICRTMVQQMDDHKVHTLISMAGPQLGVYGESFFDFLKYKHFRDFTLENVYLFAYSWVAQKTISVANMWSDPMHRSDFLKESWLALYNGLLDDKGNAARKANFVRLQKAVFVTGIPSTGPGGYDGGIQPSSSGVFGYWADGNASKVVDMKSQKVYSDDTFGLKTLDDAGKLVTQAIPGIGHHTWVDTKSVFEQYILPHLV